MSRHLTIIVALISAGLSALSPFLALLEVARWHYIAMPFAIAWLIVTFYAFTEYGGQAWPALLGAVFLAPWVVLFGEIYYSCASRHNCF